MRKVSHRREKVGYYIYLVRSPCKDPHRRLQLWHRTNHSKTDLQARHRHLSLPSLPLWRLHLPPCIAWRHTRAEKPFVQGIGHHSLSRCGNLIGLEALLMDPCLVPSFWPVAAAIDRICKIGNVNMTVLDGMNLFSVHDQTIGSMTIRENSLEQVQQPYEDENNYNTYNNSNNINIPVRKRS